MNRYSLLFRILNSLEGAAVELDEIRDAHIRSVNERSVALEHYSVAVVLLKEGEGIRPIQYVFVKTSFIFREEFFLVFAGQNEMELDVGILILEF